MKETAKDVLLRINGEYTVYTWSSRTHSAHRIELTILNLLDEFVFVDGDLEGRVAIATARVRSSGEVISLQIKLTEDLILPGWDTPEITPIEDEREGVCFRSNYESAFAWVLRNENRNFSAFELYFCSDEFPNDELIQIIASKSQLSS
jgi:hypothetical protein